MTRPKVIINGQNIKTETNLLKFKGRKFIKSQFESETELEKVIIDNYEDLFGPDSFYLPKTKIL